MLGFFSLPRIVPNAVLAALVALLVAGCGSSDDETERFDEEGYAITFEYPAELERTEDVELSETAGQAEDTLALGLSEDSGIFIQRYRLRQAVTEENAHQARREFDAVLSRLSGLDVTGERIEVGDLTAFRYELDRLETPENGRSTIIVVLDGRTEYFLNCQSVPDEREELEDGCRQMIETLEPR
ncbi:MAG: hypothetical protein ACRDL4_03680 [Thermoleophilaceae bacterium]